MKIDPKDLIPMPTPFQIGGVFYRLEENGEYSLCVFHEEEKGNAAKWSELMYLTELYKYQNRLFVRRDRPWHRIRK